MKYNCFTCDEKKEYECYTPLKDRCAYKIVSENDIKKRKNGDKNITLMNMLLEYERGNKNGKDGAYNKDR